MLISRRARQKYQLDSGFFQPDGHIAFRDYATAQAFARQISAQRRDPVPASDLQALSLLDEALRLLIREYERREGGMLAHARQHAQQRAGQGVQQALLRFVEEFPPLPVMQGQMTAADFLTNHPPLADRAAPDLALEGMLLIHVFNQNPAVHPYKDLFDEEPLTSAPPYALTLHLLRHFLAQRPASPLGGSADESLLEALLAPAKASPYSLEGQLQFIAERWGHLLGETFRLRLLRAMDFLREEVIRQHGPFDLLPQAEVPTYQGEPEYERYSPDREWMPRLVLMAKNTYVWLEQLSRKYQHWIKTLDQIPDEELDLLAQRGFTGLWLIGLWERSRASQRIKQRMGDADAVASAYSLYAYEIAADLGGWEALANLRQRAWARGIRLAADMVPNHMGIDSLWVIEHPDWFLSLDHPPYPSYTFNGEDLSDHPRVGIFLEDHYYDRSDAAVVFKRLDRQSGEARYIYHGNDGTSLPWNDTAQLDYTKAEVREAVIQTILHVARHFPIIRFDAAMTLAKKHIQRLWFPEPGTGGAIPSRAERGMSKSEFDAKVPNEFWREVVDRVAAEIPDTLLLAEAFWFMEGYFVRTLGMHRVYNSAFMHMLRDEENAKYRQAIKNTLEFDPQILKRYVNFMNNPDEKTAIEQFGNGDKYFGVCTLLVTLPGLPMFGHGQIEGFREKYGMEFRRPKWEETPDEGLIRGHEWRIFPLLHRRPLFADVEAFCLFDFYTPQGNVDENVFAYSNRLGEERALVIYHNKFAETQGWIRLSAASLEKSTGWLRQKSLGEALQLPHQGYAIVRDYVTHLERMFSCQELWEKGLFAELKAYECHVWLDWCFVEGEKWRMVYEALNGAAVESVQVKYVEMFVAPEAEATPPAPKVKSPQRTPRAKRMKRKKAAEKSTDKWEERNQDGR